MKGRRGVSWRMCTNEGEPRLWWWGWGGEQEASLVEQTQRDCLIKPMKTKGHGFLTRVIRIQLSVAATSQFPISKCSIQWFEGIKGRGSRAASSMWLPCNFSPRGWPLRGVKHAGKVWVPGKEEDALASSPAGTAGWPLGWEAVSH